MKIKYLGMKSAQRKTGCPVCGAKARTSYSYEYSKRMCLPSGLIKFFIMNKEEDVSYEDGLFLKGFKYVYGGKVYYPFVEV